MFRKVELLSKTIIASNIILQPYTYVHAKSEANTQKAVIANTHPQQWAESQTFKSTQL